MFKRCGRYDPIMQKIALRDSVNSGDPARELNAYKLPSNQMEDKSILQVENDYGFQAGTDVEDVWAYLEVIRDMELSRAGIQVSSSASV